jgi:hypothetical protein
MEFLGLAIYFVIGFLLGATVMYVGPILIEWLRGDDYDEEE